MKPKQSEDLLDELLGSAHVLVSAVSGVMEQSLLADASGRQLTLSQLKILKLLDLTGTHSIGDIAAFLGVSDAAASKAVERLVQRKYLRRTEASSDRRSSNVSLAAPGRKLLDRYDAAKGRKLAEAFRGLKAEDVRRTTEFLETLTKGIVNGSANPDSICLQCGIYLKKRCLVREAVRSDCSYQQRKNRRELKSHAEETQVPARSGHGMGPPG